MALNSPNRIVVRLVLFSISKITRLPKKVCISTCFITYAYYCSGTTWVSDWRD